MSKLTKLCILSLTNPYVDNGQVEYLHKNFPLLFRGMEVLSIKNHLMFEYLKEDFKFRNYLKNKWKYCEKINNLLLKCLREKRFYQLKKCIDAFLIESYPYVYSSYIMAQLVAIALAFAVSFGYKYIIEKILNSDKMINAFYKYPKYDFHYVYENIFQVYYLDVNLYKKLIIKELPYEKIYGMRKVYPYGKKRDARRYNYGCSSYEYIKFRDNKNIEYARKLKLID